MVRAALESQQDLSVRLLAEEICRNLVGKDYSSEALAIYYFVLTHTRYMRDPRTIELVKAPRLVVQEILAGRVPNLDCDDLATLLAALLLSTGAEVRFVTVAFKNAFYQGQRQYSHVFVQAREPRTNAWITLDPVAGDKTTDMINRTKAAMFWPVA
jgi:transglutaminase-like putative cysteine protease